MIQLRTSKARQQIVKHWAEENLLFKLSPDRIFSKDHTTRVPEWNDVTPSHDDARRVSGFLFKCVELLGFPPHDYPSGVCDTSVTISWIRKKWLQLHFFFHVFIFLHKLVRGKTRSQWGSVFIFLFGFWPLLLLLRETNEGHGYYVTRKKGYYYFPLQVYNVGEIPLFPSAWIESF